MKKTLLTSLLFCLILPFSMMAQTGGADCEEDVTFDDSTTYEGGDIQGSNSVTVSRTFLPGESLIIRGGQTIELVPGFEYEAVPGAYLETEIAECVIQCEGGCFTIGVTTPADRECYYEWQDHPD